MELQRRHSLRRGFRRVRLRDEVGRDGRLGRAASHLLLGTPVGVYGVHSKDKYILRLAFTKF